MTTLDRSEMPVSTASPQFIFPQYHTTYLSNGIKVYVIEDHTQPLVSISLTIKDGAISESIGGLSRFCARMFTRGTSKRSGTKIADDIDFLGASISSSAGWDATETSVLMLAEFTEEATEILADCILHPQFSTEEIERLRRQSIAEIQQITADQTNLATSIFNHVVFAEHPYSHRRYGSTSSLVSITRDDCLSWKEHLESQEQFFIVAGNISASSAVSLLEKHFGAMKYHPQSLPTFPMLKSASRRVAITDKQDALQSTIIIGGISISHTHPDYPALDLANSICGGMFTSRINGLLREKHGYTYGARSYFDTRKHATTHQASSSVGKESTAHSIQIILEEMNRMRHEPVTAEEFQTAKQYLLGSFVRDLETPHDVSQLLQTIELYDFPKDYYTNYFATISTMNHEDLFPVQQRYFDVDSMTIAASGEVEYLAKELAQFGTVEIITLDV
ncbi:MAG: insulinase family protein [Ignavibacteria bacterium]|nr:insulinase family protein [Ignavibacteria bacterium]